MRKTRYVARCTCGEVEVEMQGAPMISLVCHCDDCQAGSSQLEALPNAPAILDPSGGTAYALYRNDRISFTRGEKLVAEHRLKPEAGTRRVVATCCNSAMLMRLDDVLHWTPVYGDRIADAPRPEMRINTRFAPAGATVPADMPNAAGTPLRFVTKVIGAKLGMLLGR